MHACALTRMHVTRSGSEGQEDPNDQQAEVRIGLRHDCARKLDCWRLGLLGVCDVPFGNGRGATHLFAWAEHVAGLFSIEHGACRVRRRRAPSGDVPLLLVTPESPELRHLVTSNCALL